MLGNLALDPLPYLLRPRRSSVRLKLHVSAGVFLSPERVPDADDAGIGDSRVGEEERLELGGRDLQPGDFDEFL